MWWCFAALCALCGFVRAAPVDIELLPSAVVRGKSVSVGDVARIGKTSPALAAIRIGAAPLAGYAGSFSRAGIEAAVRGQPSTATIELAWRGAERVSVRRESSLVDGGDLAAAARRHLEAAHGGRFEELELTALGAVADVLVPAGMPILRPRPASTLRQRTVVWIDVLVDGAAYRTVAVPFRARAWKTMLVARRALPADAALGGDDLGAERREVLGADLLPITVPATWQGMRLREALAEGDVLQARHLLPRGSVRSGERVTLTVADGPVRIETAAVAMEDALAGGLVHVKPAGGGDVVLARVVAEKTVAIEGH